MIEDLEVFYECMKEASFLGKDIAKYVNIKDYNKIIFCGVGGSAYAGEVVKSLNLKIPVFIVREDLPEIADKKTLCFIVSYSGNTEETIKLYHRAKLKKCKIIIISSGGKLGKLNERVVLIPKGYMPREAFVYLLFPVLNILKIDYRDCFEIIKRFDIIEVKRVARYLKEKTPVVYCSSENIRFLGYRWQTFFNENSKALAHSNYFPEIAHNEIEADLDEDFQRILLFDKKTEVIEKAIKMLKPLEIELKGKTLLGKIFYGTYFGYLLSYYVAKLEGVDYKSIEKIEALKR